MDYEMTTNLNVVGTCFKQILPVQIGCSDYRLCAWPRDVTGPTATKNPSGDPGGTVLARHFDQLNEPTLSNLETVLEMEAESEEEKPEVITFSHFLPRIEVIPVRGVVPWRRNSRCKQLNFSSTSPTKTDSSVRPSDSSSQILDLYAPHCGCKD